MAADPRPWRGPLGLALTALVLATVAVVSRRLDPGPVPPPGEVTPATAVRWLGDFESASDLASWRARGAGAELTPDHATHGSRAVRITFHAGRAPRLELAPEDGDWAPWGRVVLDVASREPEQERVQVRIRDRAGRTYLEEVHLAAGARAHVSIAIPELAHYVDVRRVRDLALYRWQPAHDATFDLDAVALLPPQARSAPADAAAAALDEVRPLEQWQAAWTSSLVKLEPDPHDLRARRDAVELALAGRESESFQVVLVGSTATAARVHVRAVLPSLAGPGGAGPLAVRVRRVAWVHTRRPYYPVEHVGAWPDPLPLADVSDVPRATVQPLWVTVTAPAGATPGAYRGRIELQDESGRRQDIALQVRVRAFSLPATPRLATAFELDRGLLARAYRTFVPGGAAWRDRTDELERRCALDLLAHRVSPMLDADPLDARFAATMPGYLAHGLSAFAVGNRGGNQDNDWPADPAALAHVVAWYGEAAAALRQRGLLERAFVYAWDEPAPGLPAVLPVLGALRRAAPGLRLLVALDRAPDPDRYRAWIDAADILCLRVTAWDEDLARRYRERGKELWLYVASPSPPSPSLVVDQPALAARVLPWLCWKLGARGLLYWSVDSWRVNPWRDTADFASDQNLSGTLLYPAADGPVTSIRLELLRDGLEDYDYLALLDDAVRAARAAGRAGAFDLARAEALLEVPPEIAASPRAYGKDPAPLLARREAVAQAIEALQTP